MQGGYGGQGYGGYGYQQGYGGQGFTYEQQQAFQQQQWMMQQQMYQQQQQGYGQQGQGQYGQQFGGQQGQQAQGQQGQGQQGGQQDFGGKGGQNQNRGQGGKGGGGRDFSDLGRNQGGKDNGGNKGGRDGGKGGQQGGQQGGQKKKDAPVQMTFEEHQAAQKAKREEQAKARAAAKAAAAAAPKQEAPTPAPAAEPAPAVEAPKEEPPAPAAPKEEAKPAEAEVEDWEDQAEEEEKEEAPPAPEPVKEEPKKEAPKKEAPKEEVRQDSKEEVKEEAEDEVVEEAAPKKEGDLKEPDPRSHLNVVFIGHVDAGKSTTCGSILYLCNCVDDRAIEKYKKEAADKNRESWFLAYIMDTSEEEKAKGKTVEVGRAHFETENRRFTILDAPGHKSYVPNMIAGASQADIGVLIISARKGEFETGFERGGQTREHAMLAKTLGVEHLLIAVNKMDDPSVEWAESRYTEITSKLAPFLKTAGFKPEQITYLPLSGLTGDNVKERQKTPTWYKEKPLLETLDKLEVPQRRKDLALRIPMLDGFKDMGATMAIGKIEQGTARPGMKCIVMPEGKKCTISSVFINDEEMGYANCGENVTLKMSGISEDSLSKGFVLCGAEAPIRVVSKFKAQMQVVELPEERPVLTSGYKAVLHIHVANEECEILKLYDCINKADAGKKGKKELNPRFVREGSIVTCSISLARPTSVAAFTDLMQCGRFTLRDEGRTIAIGRVTELPKEDAAKKK